MASNIVRHWNNRVIRHRGDGYLSGTDMARANGKLIGNWLKLESTQKLIETFKSRYSDQNNGSGIEFEAVYIIQGGIPENQGTWLHPKIAIQFGQWCSPDFALQVSDWIQELLTTGSVTIYPAPAQFSLPPHVEAAEVATAIESIHNKLSHIDPRLAQILIDRAMQTVMPLLPSAAPEIKLSGAVEMAENLGFSVGKEQSTLGKTIARAWRDAYGSEPQEVKRECGGAMRKLKVYPSDDPIVIATIKEFYADREIS